VTEEQVGVDDLVDKAQNCHIGVKQRVCFIHNLVCEFMIVTMTTEVWYASQWFVSEGRNKRPTVYGHLGWRTGWRKSLWITRVIRIHLLEIMNVCTKFPRNPSHSCRNILHTPILQSTEVCFYCDQKLSQIHTGQPSILENVL